MKVNLEWVRQYERLANKFRHIQDNRAKDRHDLHLSKAKHPSRARSNGWQNASLEEVNDRRVEL